MVTNENVAGNNEDATATCLLDMYYNYTGCYFIKPACQFIKEA